jgi:hypothetical protein
MCYKQEGIYYCGEMIESDECFEYEMKPCAGFKKSKFRLNNAACLETAGCAVMDGWILPPQTTSMREKSNQ